MLDFGVEHSIMDTWSDKMPVQKVASDPKGCRVAKNCHFVSYLIVHMISSIVS